MLIPIPQWCSCANWSGKIESKDWGREKEGQKRGGDFLPRINQNWGRQLKRMIQTNHSEIPSKLLLVSIPLFFATSINLIAVISSSSFLFFSLLYYACRICSSTSPSMSITELWWCTIYHRPLWNSYILVTLNGPESTSTKVFMVTQAISVRTRARTSRTWKLTPCSQLNASCQLCITALYLGKDTDDLAPVRFQSKMNSKSNSRDQIKKNTKNLAWLTAFATIRTSIMQQCPFLFNTTFEPINS